MPGEPTTHGLQGEAGKGAGKRILRQVQARADPAATLCLTVPTPANPILRPQPPPQAAGVPGDAGSGQGSVLSLTTPIVCEWIKGYARYSPLAVPAVRPNCKLLIYYEPIGYAIGWEGSRRHIHLSQDARIRRRGGTAVLWSKDKIVDYDVTIPYPPGPVYLTNTIEVGWLGPGEYELDIVLHDRIGVERVASQTLLFQVLPSPVRASGSCHRLSWRVEQTRGYAATSSA